MESPMEIFPAWREQSRSVLTRLLAAGKLYRVLVRREWDSRLRIEIESRFVFAKIVWYSSIGQKGKASY